MRKRIKFVEQTNETECGLCCIYMLLSFYGLKINYFDFKRKWLTGRDGLSYLDLKMIANHLNFEAKVYRLQTTPHILPAIIHINQNHFVVLERMNKGKYVILDPKIGEYQLNEEEFFQMQPNNYLVIVDEQSVPVQKDNDLRENPSIIRKIFQSHLFRNYKIRIFQILIATFVFQAITFLTPFFVRWLIDSPVLVTTLFWQLIMIVIGIVLIQMIVMYGKNILINKLQNKMSLELASELVTRILSWSMQTIHTTNKKDLVHRYNGLVIVQELFSERIISLWLDLLIMTACLTYIFYSSLEIGIVICLLTIAEIILYSLTVRNKKKYLNKEVLTQRNALGSFMQVSENLPLIKSKNVEEVIYKRWSSSYKNYIGSIQKRYGFNQILLSFHHGISMLIPLIAIIVFVAKSGESTTGDIIVIYIMVSNFINPLNKVINSMDEIIYNLKYYQRITELAGIPKENNGEKLLTDSDKMDIHLENVHFRYNYASPVVLREISLQINQGDFIAIIGKSGCGKSTLGQLILSHIEPSSGQIKYNSLPNEMINKKSLREVSSYVPQISEVIDGSIYFNITLGKESVAKEEVMQVCKEAGILEEIENLPMGFETLLSKGENNLSGGQIQRICLARALLNRPKIMVLDEPTASLDIYNEHIIQKSIENLQCTRILITHRLNTIVNADNIIILDQGKIIGCGTHDQLYNENADYKNKFDTYMYQYSQKEIRYA